MGSSCCFSEPVSSPENGYNTCPRWVTYWVQCWAHSRCLMNFSTISLVLFSSFYPAQVLPSFPSAFPVPANSASLSPITPPQVRDTVTSQRSPGLWANLESLNQTTEPLKLKKKKKAKIISSKGAIHTLQHEWFPLQTALFRFFPLF